MKNYGKHAIRCPEPDCGRPTRVIKTRKEGNRIRRERECSRSHRHETVERVAPPRKRLTPAQAARKRWRRK